MLMRVMGFTLLILCLDARAQAQESSAPHPFPAGQDGVPIIEVRQRMPACVEDQEAAPIEITVLNKGDAAAENVTIVDTLASGHDLVDATPPPEQLRGKLVWPLGVLPAGEQRVVHLRLKLKAGAGRAELRNHVTATFQMSVSHTATAAVKRPVLALQVLGPKTGVMGAATFRITASNTGCRVAHQVTLQARLPIGLSHPGGDDLEYEIGDLEAGESRVISLPVTLTKPGTQSSRFRLVCRGQAPVEQECSVSVQEIKLFLAVNGPKLLYENRPGGFEVAVRNDGTDMLGHVGVQINLPEGMAFVRANDNARYDPDSHSLIWNAGDLPRNETRSLLWTGVAKAAGNLEGQVTGRTDQRVLSQTTWKITVIKGDPGPVGTPLPDIQNSGAALPGRGALPKSSKTSEAPAPSEVVASRIN
jgi:hypothetical protein